VLAKSQKMKRIYLQKQDQTLETLTGKARKGFLLGQAMINCFMKILAK
jgi:hypothetical protein